MTYSCSVSLVITVLYFKIVLKFLNLDRHLSVCIAEALLRSVCCLFAQLGIFTVTLLSSNEWAMKEASAWHSFSPLASKSHYSLSVSRKEVFFFLFLSFTDKHILGL